MKPTGAAVRCAAGFEVDEDSAPPADSEADSEADSLGCSVAEVSLLAGPVVVMLVARVEPLVVTVDSITPVVTDPDSVPVTTPEETTETTPATLVAVDVTVPSLLVMVVSKVAVDVGTVTVQPEG